MRIVVPSHGRSDLIQGRTLRLLGRLGLLGQTTLVVAEKDYVAYSQLDVPLEIGVPGLVANRNHISGMFPLGTAVLSLDDDLLDIKVAGGDGVRSVEGPEFVELAEQGFSLLERFDGGIWGVNPSSDPRFLLGGSEFSVGAMPIEGCLFGFFSGLADMTLPAEALGAFDDMERVCKIWYQRFNAVRLNRVSHFQSTSAEGGKGADERKNLCDEVHRIVGLYPRIAVHTFGKLPNQSKCRVGIRSRSAVSCPSSTAEVDAARQRIESSPLPPMPKLHDGRFVPDEDGRRQATGEALQRVTSAALKVVSLQQPAGLEPVSAAATAYLGRSGQEAVEAAHEIRRSAARVMKERGSRHYCRDTPEMAELHAATEAVYAAGKLMTWDIWERTPQ